MTNLTSKKTNNKVFRILLIVFGSIIILTAGTIASFQLKAMNDRNRMQNYLQNKYGKEFVVENYRVEGAGIGVEGDPVADAYPKNNAKLRFDIWDRGRFHVGRHAYSDNYVSAVWSGEAMLSLANEVKQIVGDTSKYEVTIGFSGELADYHILPSFDQAKNSFADDMRISLVVTPEETINRNTIDLHSERVLRLITLLKSYNLKASSISYSSADNKSGIYFGYEQLKAAITIEQIKANMKVQ